MEKQFKKSEQKAMSLRAINQALYLKKCWISRNASNIQNWTNTKAKYPQDII